MTIGLILLATYGLILLLARTSRNRAPHPAPQRDRRPDHPG
jgi:hypothetical protein